MKQILALDIGGTNSRLGAFRAEDGDLEKMDSLWIPTRSCQGIAQVFDQASQRGFPLALTEADAVGIAVAGPVRGGTRADPPNIAWDVDLPRDLPELPAQRVVLLNDFLAQAYAAFTPAIGSARVVVPGEPVPQGVLGVIGAGTGLGMAVLACDRRGERLAIASEGGHMLFPFADDEEWRFKRFLQETTGREQVIGDMVLSGTGLAALHRFLTGQDLSPEEVAAAFERNPRTVELFARLYGRACRNLALGSLTLGGVLVSGGIAAKNPAIVEHPAFAAEFHFSYSHKDILEQMQVRLNAEQESGLWGAAYRACQEALC